MERSETIRERVARRAVSQRLRDFYARLKAEMEADAEEFYRKIVELEGKKPAVR